MPCCWTSHAAVADVHRAGRAPSIDVSTSSARSRSRAERRTSIQVRRRVRAGTAVAREPNPFLRLDCAAVKAARYYCSSEQSKPPAPIVHVDQPALVLAC